MEDVQYQTDVECSYVLLGRSCTH